MPLLSLGKYDRKADVDSLRTGLILIASATINVKSVLFESKTSSLSG